MRRRVSHEPSLVPLADMLTNTVGIVMFILIFTVLTAGGAVLAKRLPMEQDTPAKGRPMACWAGRLYPIADELEERFWKEVGDPPKSGSAAENAVFVEKLRQHSVSDLYVTLTCEPHDYGNGWQLSWVYSPIEGMGESVEDLNRPDSHLRKLISQTDKDKEFVLFIVRTDGIDVFNAAREIARDKGIPTGWAPHAKDKPLRFGRGGQTFGPQ